MQRKIALSIYLVIGTVNIALGWIYVTSDEFLSYHAQAIGASWDTVDPGTQTLISALMKVSGGGWCALGFLTIAIALSGLKRNGVFALWALPIGTLIFYGPTFVATWTVYRETGAQSPWLPSLVMIGLVLCAMMTDAPWSVRNRGVA